MHNKLTLIYGKIHNFLTNMYAVANKLPMKIKKLGTGVYIVETPKKFLGMEIGLRMTIFVLNNGDIALHSPVPLTKELEYELSALGNIKYLISPNKFHHLYVKDYKNVYTDFKLFCVPGLELKRKDLEFTGILSEHEQYEWGNELQFKIFMGIPSLNEAVFHHKPSKSLIFTDLVMHYSKNINLSAKLFAKLEGVYTKIAVPRLVRYMLVRDKKAAKKSLDIILSWDFERVIFSHGDIIESNGKNAVEKAFSWL